MSYALRKGPCVVCGEYTERTRPAVAPHRCIACAIRVANEAALQMAAKSGPVYEKWKAATSASSDRWVNGVRCAQAKFEKRVTDT